jgi:hypothetical protein
MEKLVTEFLYFYVNTIVIIYLNVLKNLCIKKIFSAKTNNNT